MEKLVEKKNQEADSNELKYVTACGKEIIVGAQTLQHLLAHPDVVEFLQEAISKAELLSGAECFEQAICLNRLLGKSLLVEAENISADDEVDFAFRAGREWPVRVALNENGKDCDSVTLVIVADKKRQKYLLQTAYIGYPTPSMPYHIEDNSGSEFQEALEFWCAHALAYDPKTMGKPFKSTWNKVINKIK